jgi:hypothetical protein
LIVRRVRTLNPQGELLPSWELFPFLTNRSEPLELVEAEHRQHAAVELAIRDLKDQALAHFPSGQFTANAAWTVIACLAHNLLRWMEHPDRLARRHRPHGAHPTPPAAHAPRPADHQRPALDAAPPRPLALASRLHPRTHPHPSTARRRLTAATNHDVDSPLTGTPAI